jgi:radical SAM superfamily enzyme YgiQ (UPF0313 family)
VTADFFTNADNLSLARAAGCIGFFSGVESFSRAQVSAFNKKQNLVLPQEEIIRSCLEAGLVFHYGLIFDLVEQTIDDLLAETDFIVANPRITLPSFLGFTIPLLGTPLFRQPPAGGPVSAQRPPARHGRAIARLSPRGRHRESRRLCRAHG